MSLCLICGKEGGSRTTYLGIKASLAEALKYGATFKVPISQVAHLNCVRGLDRWLAFKRKEAEDNARRNKSLPQLPGGNNLAGDAGGEENPS